MYSVIIPHKNCPNLLKRCLQSLPIRGDIQVIVVDDNSDDIASVKTVEESFVFPDKTFLYTTEGKGAGYARNVGLEHAHGEWLVFSDSDDLFTEDAFTQFDKYAELGYDVVYFKHKAVYSDTLEPCVRFSERNNRIENYLTSLSEKNEKALRYIDVVPWAKMIRRSIVLNNKLQFDVVPASNDVTFISHAAYYAKTITASWEPVYYVTYRRGSITRTPSKENLYSSFKVSLKHSLFMDEIGSPQLKGRVLSRVIKAYRLFGFDEAKRYIKTANEYKVSIFTGLYITPKDIFTKLKNIFNKNYFQG